MLNFSTVPSKIKLQKEEIKEELYELACECTVAFLSEKQASRIIEEMLECIECKNPIYLVIEGEEIT